MFVTHQMDVYEGMIVGENAKENDLVVNITREKKLTNVRASASDEAIRITPVVPFTLEQAMEWISDEELIEVTPKQIAIETKAREAAQIALGKAELRIEQLPALLEDSKEARTEAKRSGEEAAELRGTLAGMNLEKAKKL